MSQPNLPFEIVWKPIEGFDGRYEVSNTGEVKSIARMEKCKNGGVRQRDGRILKQNVGNTGRCVVVLCKDGNTYPRLVHRLVAQAFIPNPENKPNIDHIDTNPRNNRVDNLRWVTQHENAMNPLTRIHNSKSKMGHGSYYKGFSEETREKLRQAQLGRKASPETRAKLSDIHKSSPKCRAATAALIEARKGKSWKLVNGKRVYYKKEETA